MIPDHVTIVRQRDIAWEPLGTHGLRRKLLRAAADGHVTSLVEIPKAWRGGGIAHYHRAFEEVYVVEGSVTVGANRYWHSGDYFYRPAMVVHGHDERSEEGALAVIRSDGPCDLLLIHAPSDVDEYPLEPIRDGRGHVMQVRVRDVPRVRLAGLPRGWTASVLSADPQSGARTIAVDVPNGWRHEREATTGLETAWESYVTAGSVASAAEVCTVGDYACGPAGTLPFEATHSDTGATFILWQFPRTA